MSKLKHTVLDYIFELPSDEELINTLKHGMSKKTAIMLTGNNKVLGQTKNTSSHHILDNLDFVISNYKSEKIYYDSSVVDNIDNSNFYNSIGEQFLKLHLFGYKNVQIIKYYKDAVDVQIMRRVKNEWKLSVIKIVKLSSIDVHDIEKYHNTIFIDDNQITSSLYKNELIGNSNDNLIISEDNIFEHRNSLYKGSSFYITDFFKRLLDNTDRSELLTEDNIKIFDAIEEEKFNKNKFDFNGKVIFSGVEKNVVDEYKKNLSNNLSSQLFVDYYDKYTSYQSVNLFLDNLMEILSGKEKYLSFAEYNLAFTLDLIDKNEDLFKDIKFEISDNRVARNVVNISDKDFNLNNDDNKEKLPEQDVKKDVYPFNDYDKLTTNNQFNDKDIKDKPTVMYDDSKEGNNSGTTITSEEKHNNDILGKSVAKFKENLLSKSDSDTPATDNELSTSSTDNNLGTSATDNELSTSATDNKLSTSATDNNLGTSATDNKLSTSSTDNNLGTSATGNKLSTSATDNNLGTLSTDNKLSTSVTDNDLSTSSADNKLSTSTNDNKLSTSANDNNLGTSANDNNLGTSVNDSKLSTSATNNNLGTSSADNENTALDKSFLKTLLNSKKTNDDERVNDERVNDERVNNEKVNDEKANSEKTVQKTSLDNDITHKYGLDNKLDDFSNFFAK